VRQGEGLRPQTLACSNVQLLRCNTSKTAIAARVKTYVWFGNDLFTVFKLVCT
jgi:hypothetical protein